VNLVIRRITIAVLAAALAGAVLAVPASSNSDSAAVAKKKAKRCKKKGKKGKKAKKRKGCKGGIGSSGSGLPGEATPASPKQPNFPPPPPNNPVLHVSSLSVSDGTLLGGNSTNGLVTLDHAAAAGGQQVDLSSDVAPRVQVPASVVVVSGQKTASFQVDTTFGTPITATLTASIDTSNATTALKVVDRPSVASVKLQRRCFTPGTWPTNRVTLDIPAPADTSVALGSSDPLSLSLPLATVTVPSGSTSALFAVNALAASDGVTVSATAPSTPPQSDSATVSLTDPATHADGLTVDPDTVVAGSGSTGTVTLDCEAPPGGTTVTLSSADPGVTFDSTGSQSATVDVPEGQLSADFTISTDGGLADGQYDVSATVGADTPVHATLTIDSSLPT
jgi:trimeric autotransporter adhesin